MKIQLLTICMYLSIIASAQSFQWNNDNQSPAQQTSQVDADNVQASTQYQAPAYSTSQIRPKDPMVDEVGIAHPYPNYYDGSPTALGEVFHQNLMTAGHKTLPLGTIVKIARIDNGLSTTVRINDRGAYCDGCIIDLSTAAAQKIGLLSDRKTNVTLTVMGMSDNNPSGEMALADEPRFTARGGTNVYESSPTSNQYTAPPVKCDPQTKTTEHTRLQARGVMPTNAEGIMIIDAPIAPFAVQLGSYISYSNAEKHALSLQGKGFNNVYLLREQRPGQKTLNRVIVTPFASKIEAENYIADLKEYHNMKGLVFQTMLVEIED